MPNYQGVEYHEKCPESPEISIDPENESRTQMRLFTPWDSFADQSFSKAFLGFAAVATDWPGQAGKKFISRSGWPTTASRGARPFEHPDWPNGFYMAKSLSAKGFTPNSPSIGANDTATFQEADVTLSFASPELGYRLLDDGDCVAPAGLGLRGVPEEYYCLRAMEVDESPTSKAQTLPPNAGLLWAGTGRAVSAAAFITLWETDITIDWFPVPVAAYNEAAFLALVGKSNAKAFPPDKPAGAPDPLLGQKASGTLVMGTPGRKVIRMGDTEYALRVRLKLKFYPNGANKLFWHDRPGAQGGPGYHAVARQDGSVLFPPADFTTAFIPPA